MRQAKVKTVQINSTQRTPGEEAAAMYTNASAKNGVADGYKLYASAGDRVTKTFEDARAAGLNREEIIERMTATIMQIGPSNVSRHSADPSTLNVIDISSSAIGVKASAFNNALLSNTDISRVFSPFTAHRDPAFHVEIPQQ